MKSFFCISGLSINIWIESTIDWCKENLIFDTQSQRDFEILARIKITTLKKIKKLQFSRHWWNPIDLLFSFIPSNQIYLCIMQRLTFLKVKSFLQFYAKSALLWKTITANSLKGKKCNSFVFLKQLYRWNGSLWEELYNKRPLYRGWLIQANQKHFLLIIKVLL